MNKYHLLIDSDEFYSSLSNDILGSKKEILLQFLTYEADVIGLKLTDLLMRKASEGVVIKLLVDGFNDYMINDNFIVAPKTFYKGYLREYFGTKRMFKNMLRSGILIKRTGKSLLPIFYTNHKKIIIIDDVAYLGGFNISEHNFSWHDFMVRIEGPLVKDIARDFKYTWQDDERNYMLKSGKDFLVSDIPDKDSLIYDLLLKKIGEAKKEIFIESPYFSGKRIINLLEVKSNQGVKVTLIMPFSNNRLYYGPLTRYYAKKLNKINLRFYTGFRGMTHAKMIMVDDTLFFGSSNLSEQSSHLCKEIMVMTKDKYIVNQAVNRIIKKDIKLSVKMKNFSESDLFFGKLFDFMHNRILTTLIRRSN